MSDPMQEIMASFFVECEELLEALIDALQAMSDGDATSETINVAFRAVHSIKGGAAAFGLDDLVRFAHQFETVMDACRAGRLTVGAALSDLLLRCGDALSDLVRCARDTTPIDQPTTDALLQELEAWVGDSPIEPQAEIEFAPMTMDLGDLGDGDVATGSGDMSGVPVPGLPDLALPGDEEAGGSWLEVRFRPDPELYESGNEPLHLLRTLADLGPCDTRVSFDPPEDLSDSTRFGHRLTWAIRIKTDAAASAAVEVFEFAEGLCVLDVVSSADAHRENSPRDPGDLPTPAASPAPLVDFEPAPQVATARPDASDPQKPPPSIKSSTTQANPKASPTVRVDLERIDRLVNLVGELVINQAMLSQAIHKQAVAPNSPVAAGLDEFLQLTRNIQESVMMIRAQPVKSLFQRMSRIVRETSAAVDKSVRFLTDGEATEIDKTAIERLADPLTHMIRNAVDHGLESREVRRAAGKPDQGEIRLSARHRSGRVIIEISDDGAGINREKVRSIAVEKGLIPENAGLSDTEIDQLLFLPGFSTAREVSNLSGRGVGMDVVKTQITALGGRVTIESRPGLGSTFSISLPLTLAVLDGMVVTVAGETLVLPLSAIVETLSVAHGEVRHVQPGQTVLRVRDRFAPVLDLGVSLGYRDECHFGEGAIALLISPEEGTLAALVVDSIEDQRQVVIKGLQDSYGRVPGVAAATILGDGQIALILDPSDLVRDAAVGADLQPFQTEARRHG
jgi:two-component system, chemotaxis family, sensor kinase CheA